MSFFTFHALGIVVALSFPGKMSATESIGDEIPPDAEIRELPVRPGQAFDRIVGYFVKNPLWKDKPEGSLIPSDLKVATRCYYPNGKLCEETFFVTDPRSGESVRQGLRREWFPNGQLHLERHYQKGELHGLCNWTAPLFTLGKVLSP